MPPLPVDTDEIARLLALVESGDRHALGKLLEGERETIRRFLNYRINGQLRQRIDPSDIIQGAFLEAVERINDYIDRKPMPFRIWIYRTAYQHLLTQRRVHLNADCRTVRHEVSLSDESSILLAENIATPSGIVSQAELAEKVRNALASLDDIDSEVLMLRSFEGLKNHEVAQVLGIETSAASRRYGRALLRLGQLITTDSTTGEP